MVDLKAGGACDCPDGECRAETPCTPISDCIYRIARRGEVTTKWCEIQIAYTWHLNGKCLRCQAIKTDPKDTDALIAILSKIREALGVGHKPMLSELPDEARKIRAGYDRFVAMPDTIHRVGVLDAKPENEFEDGWHKACESLLKEINA